MPDCAIFADTGWEPDAVYVHLGRLTVALPFPIYTVSAGNIRADAMATSNTTGGRFAAIPWFTVNPDGSHGMGRRQCTSEYKVRPIQRKIVELTGGRKRASANVWIGISTDEIQRMRPSRVQYIVNRHPLIEAGLSRRDCQAWLFDKGWDAPRSACIGCPFHSDREWRLLSPAEFADACEVDAAIRRPTRGIRAEQFMHAQRVPLADVDLSTWAQRGQPDLFNLECEGMCGV